MSDEEPLTEEEIRKAVEEGQQQLAEFELKRRMASARYVCGTCGLILESHTEQCPGCGDWDSIKPVRWTHDADYEA